MHGTWESIRTVDEFLYTRCAVVANGKQTFEEILRDPNEFPEDAAFEAILSVGQTAYEQKTGEEYAHVPTPNYETFSNKSEWPSGGTRSNAARFANAVEECMNHEEMKSIGLPHKLFAVFTNPDGKLYFRNIWSMRLVAYLSDIGAVKDKGWEDYIRGAEVGQVWQVPIGNRYSWMVLVRIRGDEGKGDTE